MMLEQFTTALTQASLCYVLFPTAGMAVVAVIGWAIDRLVGEAE